jgi:predicted 3-demethylubiquinone-9 3-methyltransferase (glyoxalase superfamily)
MPNSITTFLMFEGRAEEAMQFYTSLFPRSEIVHMRKYGPEGPGPEGSIMSAVFMLDGLRVMAFDSFVKHAFTFTPSMSFFVECENEPEQARLFAALSDGGAVMMPPDNYGFSTRFGWCADRFGVSWQLNLG